MPLTNLPNLSPSLPPPPPQSPLNAQDNGPHASHFLEKGGYFRGIVSGRFPKKAEERGGGVFRFVITNSNQYPR